MKHTSPAFPGQDLIDTNKLQLPDFPPSDKDEGIKGSKEKNNNICLSLYKWGVSGHVLKFKKYK